MIGVPVRFGDTDAAVRVLSAVVKSIDADGAVDDVRVRRELARLRAACLVVREALVDAERCPASPG